jgi:signal transduction histidine kinase
MLRDLTGFALVLAALLLTAIGLPSVGYVSSVSSALAQSRETVGSSRQSLKNSRKDDIAERLSPFLQSLAAYKDLIVYGAIASFGILMMGLAIGSASSGAKTNTTEQLTRLKEEKEKAENLAKLKAEFLNQVSHELRTPLAVIIGYIECITDGLYGQIDMKHNEILQVVAKQSTHLKNMIDQILIYSRLEAGKQPIRIEELQLTKVVNDLRDTFEFLCRQKGIELRWEVPREAVTMRNDATRVKEVVSNLLQNAVKYTDRGSISVRISNAPVADSVMIEVQDTGMGISEQHLTSIFEPFMQVHKTSSENSRGGIGLGLSIVKKHLDQIHGTITVESELGKGSLFRIVLPRNPDKQKSRSRWLLPFGKRLSGPRFTVWARPQTSAGSERQKPAKTRQALG